MINKILNQMEALKIFEDEAILLNGNDVMPFYKAVELFGEEAAIFLNENISINGYLKSGIDYNGIGGDDENFIHYLYKSGFFKIVTKHNHLLVIKAHKKSNGGHIWDKYWKRRK